METLGPLGVTDNHPLQERLWRYLQGGRVHSTILLVGPPTKDRWIIARSMAKHLMGTHGTTPQRIDKEIHPDVIMIRETESATIKVETVREIAVQMGIQPIEGRAKICLVDDCHKLSTAAANAFLKTLEEPGNNRYFLLLTDSPASLPITVLSRCIQFHMKPAETLDFDEKTAQVWDMAQVEGPEPLVQAAKGRDEGLQLVRYRQWVLHQYLEADSSNPDPLVAEFQDLLELEKQIRQSLNPGLGLEVHFRKYFGVPNSVR